MDEFSYTVSLSQGAGMESACYARGCPDGAVIGRSAESGHWI